MSKIVFLGDTHFGYRIDNDAYVEYIKRFYKDVFFPYLDQHDIKEVIQFGDLMDNRRYISIKTLHFIKEVFLDPLAERGITLRVFLGNHDVYYKNTNEYNSPSHVLSSYDNVILYQHISERDYGDKRFGFVPWINKENEEEFSLWIKKTDCDIILGHFELVGFEYFKGLKADHGMDGAVFKGFDAVYTGHYHTMSRKGNIMYIGTPYEMTCADLDDEKGFWVYDVDTYELERVKNPNALFKKISYDDSKEDYDKFDFSAFENCYVKAYVINRENVNMYNRFIDNLYNANAVDINVIEHDIDYDDEEEANVETQTTIDIINDTVSGIENINKDNVLTIINDLYKEATLMEVE
jgi:hypothetical protein